MASRESHPEVIAYSYELLNSLSTDNSNNWQRKSLTRGTADAVERPSPAYLLRAAGIDENT